MNKLLAVLLIAAFPTAAMAVDASGGCGLGSMVFKGQSGIAPQVLAITTNGTAFNQLFGISSGTLGCTQDGVVQSHMAAVMFIDKNKNALAYDMSVGQGETLASLEHLIGVQAQDQAAFSRMAKQNVGNIFASNDVTGQQVEANLRKALGNDAQLSKYQAAL